MLISKAVKTNVTHMSFAELIEILAGGLPEKRVSTSISTMSVAMPLGYGIVLLSKARAQFVSMLMRGEAPNRAAIKELRKKNPWMAESIRKEYLAKRPLPLPLAS